MRALVTGGTGFVGSHVARVLSQSGHEVRILHRANSKLDALSGLTYQSALGDVTDADALRVACTGCDWVFHVAAVADYWRADHAYMHQVNVEGTRKVLAAAREAGVQRTVFTSSAAAVGLTPNGVSDERVAFNMPPERFSYGHSKFLAEQIVAEVVAQGQDVVMVNPVIVMGPGDLNQISGSMVIESAKRGRWIPVAPGGASYVDVRDVARWQLAAAETGQSGERYILMTENYTHRAWFDLIAEVVGVARPVVSLPSAILPAVAGAIGLARRLGISTPIDPDQVLLSGQGVYFTGEKAWEAFGTPTIEMRDSLRDTLTYYQAQGLI